MILGLRVKLEEKEATHFLQYMYIRTGGKGTSSSRDFPGFSAPCFGAKWSGGTAAAERWDVGTCTEAS